MPRNVLEFRALKPPEFCLIPVSARWWLIYAFYCCAVSIWICIYYWIGMFGYIKLSNASFSLRSLALLSSPLPFVGRLSSDLSRGCEPPKLFWFSVVFRLLLPNPMLLFEALLFFYRMNCPVFWIKLSLTGDNMVFPSLLLVPCS